MLAGKDEQAMANTEDLQDTQENLTLRLWEGDDSVKGEILVLWGARVENAIARAFPRMSPQGAEDVVAEAIRRFWIWRNKYDPEKATVFTMLYRFAEEVAIELRTGRLKWQRAQIKEKGVDAEFFERIESPVSTSDPPDDVGSGTSPVQKALADCFARLPDLQQDILRRYADAGSYELDAATVGKDLGDLHKNGVPIPGGTIRVYRLRAWESLETCMKKKNFDLKALGYTND